MSAVSTNPSTLFGGTWEQLKDRFLLGAGDSYAAGGTGGSATHTPSGSVAGHTLTVDEIPAHSHVIRPPLHNSAGPDWGWQGWYYQDMSGWVFGPYTSTDNTGGGGSHSHDLTLSSMDTMPPYITVYMWKRIA